MYIPLDGDVEERYTEGGKAGGKVEACEKDSALDKGVGISGLYLCLWVGEAGKCRRGYGLEIYSIG